jgi:vesicle transport protein SEC22
LLSLLSNIATASNVLSYLIENSICFLCICDKSYPRKLAFTYLEDIAAEFQSSYGNEVHNPALRPYAFVQFDTFIQRTKQTYQDTRATANLDRLNDDLKDVTRVMTKNIEDLLYRGDNLDRMADMSNRLRDESKKYRQAAVRINWEAMWKQACALKCCLCFSSLTTL